MKKIQLVAIIFACMAVSQTMTAQTKRGTGQRTTARGTTTTQRRQAPVQTPAASKDWYVGGSLRLQSSSYDGKTTNTATTFSPEVGYKLNDDWSIGLGIIYTSSTNKSGEVDLTNSNYAINPYVRYTFLREGKVKLFGQGMFSVGTANNQTAGNSGGKTEAVDNKTNHWALSVGPGLSYDISDSFSLVCRFGSLSYSSSKRDTEGAKATSTIGLSLSNDVSFGFFYNF